MRDERMEALEVEHRLDEAVGRRIAVDGRHDIGAEGIADRGLVLQRIGIGLPDHLARDVMMVEPLGGAMHHRLFQAVVMQDGGIEEGRKRGLAPHDVFGLLADLRPYRIEFADGCQSGLLRHLSLRHVTASLLCLTFGLTHKG